MHDSISLPDELFRSPANTDIKRGAVTCWCRSQAPEENDCPRVKISIPSSNSDLYQDQAPQSDVANDKKESEQTYSSSIFEKMNRCWVDTTAGSNKLTEPSIRTVSLMTEGPEDDNRNDWAEYTNREISEEVRS